MSFYGCNYLYPFAHYLAVAIFSPYIITNNHARQSEDGKQVEIVSPPADAPVGERVFIDGLSGEPLSSTQIKKKKVWDTVSKGLKTGEDGIATWDGKEIKTSAGVCSAASLVGAPIS